MPQKLTFAFVVILIYDFYNLKISVNISNLNKNIDKSIHVKQESLGKKHYFIIMNNLLYQESIYISQFYS